MHLVTYAYHCCDGFESCEHADQDTSNTIIMQYKPSNQHNVMYETKGYYG